MLAGHGWKVVEEIVERVSARELVEQVFHRHSRADEHWSSAKNLWIAMDECWFVRHREACVVSIRLSFARGLETPNAFARSRSAKL